MALTTANPLSLLKTTIDMSTFSNSELHSLSLLSNTSLDTVTHAITTTYSSPFFNESESSRRQIYHHRRRDSAANHGEFQSESISIVKFIKRYLRKDKSIEIVNKNGVVVDLRALETAEEGVFEEELRRRMAERENEEELLEVMARIEGKWCSNRKKRRVIDASLLGDALPIGWKVIIALRRKGGRFFPYCRRYISPTGEYFSSCKEVSSYLKSHFGINDTKLLRDSREDLQQLQCMNSKNDFSLLELSYPSTSNTCLRIEHEKDVSITGIDNLPDVQVCGLYECHICRISFDVKDDYLKHLMSTHERTTKKYKLDSSVGDQVTVRDGNYERQACSINFNKRSEYLENSPSTDKQKTKRRRLSTCVADGVIIRDGKYECQFCDKVFEERCRYVGHVGNHVKGSIKSTKGSVPQVPGTAKTLSVDRLASKIDNSKMKALAEIAQNSIEDISSTVPEKEPSCVNNIDQLCMAISENIKNADFRLCVTDPGKEKGGGVVKAFSSSLNPCSKVSGTSNAYLRETGKGNGKDKNLLKELVPPVMETIEILVEDIGNINDALPCLDKNELKKGSDEAKANTSTNMYFRDKMSEKMMTNGTNGLSSCHIGLDVEREGQEEKTLPKVNTYASVMSMTDVETKKKAFSQEVVDFEQNSCFEAKMMPAETGIQADNCTDSWAVKSPSIEDGRSVQESKGGFEINFLSQNQEPSDIDFVGEKIHSYYMDKHNPEHVERHDNSDLATVTSDASAFGCNMSQTLLNSSSSFDEIFEKAGQNICSIDPNLESGNGFEYMKLDELEPQMYKYNALNEEDTIFLPEVSMDQEKDTRLDLGFNASANSEFPSAITSRSTSTMTCVWCGLEFFNEIEEIELQPDSVGFMCPVCRAKISKQFNELESNFSVNPQYS